MNIKTAAARIAGIVVLATLAGCGSMNPMNWWNNGPQEQAPQRLAGAASYQCADGKTLAVRYAPQGQNWAMVILPDREFRLDAPAGSAGRYTNGRTALTSQGDTVALEENGEALRSACKRTG